MFCPTWIINPPMSQACPWRKSCLYHQGPQNDKVSVDNPVYINRINPCSTCPITIYCLHQSNVFSCQKQRSRSVDFCYMHWRGPRRYRKRKVNDAQKKKDIRSCRISTFDSSSQDDIEKAGAGASEEDTSCGFCNKQYNCRNSSQFRHCIHCMKFTVWYHDKCFGARGCKNLISEKCM